MPYTWRDCPRKEGNIQALFYGLDGPDGKKKRQENQEAHQAYLKAHGNSVMVRGPLLDDTGAEPVGSVWLLDVPDLDAGRALLEGDPLYRSGVHKDTMFRRWRFGRCSTASRSNGPDTGSDLPEIRAVVPKTNVPINKRRLTERAAHTVTRRRTSCGNKSSPRAADSPPRWPCGNRMPVTDAQPCPSTRQAWLRIVTRLRGFHAAPNVRNQGPPSYLNETFSLVR